MTVDSNVAATVPPVCVFATEGCITSWSSGASTCTSCGLPHAGRRGQRVPIQTIDQAQRAFMRAADRLPTLWNLSEEYDQLLALLEDPDSDQAEVQAEVERVVGDIRTKAYGVAVVLQSLDKLAEHQRGESRRLAEKARANEAHADRLRSYALQCMQTLGVQRIETGTFLLAVRLNNPSVNVVDAAAVPSEFNRTKIISEVDKVRILQHTKTTGEVVPGTEIVRTTRLAIS